MLLQCSAKNTIFAAAIIKAGCVVLLLRNVMFFKKATALGFF